MPKRPAFNEGVDKVLSEAIAVCNQRGGEYADSWAIENLRTPLLDCVLREIGVKPLGPEQKRILVAAALCDVKLSRLVGGFKDDTLVDLINYLAVLTHWMRQ